MALDISIHAPTRGATWRRFYTAMRCFQFQSTHPYGVRHMPAHPQGSDSLFQSTHPHGVRRYRTGDFTYLSILFQSTHPHGVRQKLRRADKSLYKFQSTHPHGVRLHHITRDIRTRFISIHAPTRGATM